MYHFFIWGEAGAAWAKVSPSDCASWQSPSSFRSVSCDRAPSEIIHPSCTSCRMASLSIWRAWWASQWKECAQIFTTEFGRTRPIDYKCLRAIRTRNVSLDRKFPFGPWTRGIFLSDGVNPSRYAAWIWGPRSSPYVKSHLIVSPGIVMCDKNVLSWQQTLCLGFKHHHKVSLSNQNRHVNMEN